MRRRGITDLRAKACASRLVRMSLALGAVVVLASGGPFAASDRRVSRSQHVVPSHDQDVVQSAEPLSEWVNAVEQHTMGSFDVHAARVASWTPEQVGALLRGIPALLRSPGGARLARRGAMLHADIARLGRWGGSMAWAAASPRRPLSDAPSPVVVLTSDGTQEGYGSIAGHWQFGRFLLDSIPRGPSQDPLVVLWYRGAAAHFVGTRAFGDLELHLLEAERVLPRDAGIMFHRGVLHEMFASPTAQGMLESAALPTGTRFVIGSPEQELRRAEASLRRALGLEPGFLEARLRLGRVLEQLGQHGQAAAELGRVAGNTGDKLLLYYARLFLGSAEEALGHADEARKCYEGATALYPGALSARLALAQVVRQSGDQSSAVRIVQEALKNPDAGGISASDPWLQYHYAPGRHAGALFEQAARECREPERR